MIAAHPPHVLVVDDDASVLELVVEALGFQKQYSVVVERTTTAHLQSLVASALSTYRYQQLTALGNGVGHLP